MSRMWEEMEAKKLHAQASKANTMWKNYLCKSTAKSYSYLKLTNSCVCGGPIEELFLKLMVGLSQMIRDVNRVISYST